MVALLIAAALVAVLAWLARDAWRWAERLYRGERQ